MNRKSGEIVVAIMVGIVVLTAGISLLTGSHNARLAIEARDGKVFGGVKANFGAGAVNAVKESPGAAALAVVTAVAAGYAVDQIEGGGSKDEKPVIRIEGDGNNVNYTEGGGQKIVTDNSTKSEAKAE